ncbi:MAG: protein DA1 [Acidobacteriota bacterium]|nr:protein DA1 [Acidobacteriota bacterium]
MTRCAGCGRSVTGNYLKAMKRAWHPACFTCKGCGAALNGSFVEKNGAPWHEACAVSRFSKRCAGCGQPIQGMLITALGRNWHPDCFRCGYCGKSIKQKKFSEKDGKGFHPECYRRAFVPPCAVCADPITQRFVIDDWGNRYCDFHPKKMPACFACGKLICEALTRGGQRLPDGRDLCGICLQTLVTAPPDGARLLKEVREKMQSMGFDFGNADLPFRLVTPAELKKLAKRKKKDRPSLGMARTTTIMRGKQVVERRFEEIIIMNALPEEMFRMVAAHELCHAWLFLKGFRELPERVEEGLCTLAEGLWLERQKTEIASIRLKRLHKNPDPVYGDGFRAAKKALKKMKVGELLTYVRKNKRFPGDGLMSRLLGV